MPDFVLLVVGAPVDPARLERVLYGPVRSRSVVLAVAALGDPVAAVARVLPRFAAHRIVFAGADSQRDVCGAIEDRFGRPVLTVCA